MYYIKWVFNLKKKFDNYVIFYYVNISVKFWGLFYLVGFDRSKFLLLYENICNLSGFGNFYYVYIFIDFC